MFSNIKAVFFDIDGTPGHRLPRPSVKFQPKAPVLFNRLNKNSHNLFNKLNKTVYLHHDNNL